jgi:hypothetical protein
MLKQVQHDTSYHFIIYEKVSGGESEGGKQEAEKGLTYFLEIDK